MNVPITPSMGRTVHPGFTSTKVMRELSDFAPLAEQRLAEKLPEYVALAEADSHGLTSQHEEHRREIGHLDAQIGRLQEHEADHGSSPETRSAIAEIERQKKAAKARQAKVLESHGKKMSRAVSFRRVLESSQSFATKTLTGTAPIEALIPEVQKAPGQTWGDGAAGKQAECRGEQNEREEFAAAMIPPDVAIKSTISDIRRKAEGLTLQPRASGDGFNIDFPRMHVRAEPIAAGGIPFAWDAVALIAWLAPEKLEEEVTRLIEGFYSGYGGPIMTPADKRKAVRQSDAKLLQLEREEAEMIWRGLEAGEPLAFRPDTDPRAVLGLA